MTATPQAFPDSNAQSMFQESVGFRKSMRKFD